LDGKIVEERDAEHDGEKVEEAIIAGEQDEELEGDKRVTREMTQSPRKENKEGDHQFDEEHDGGTRFLNKLRGVSS